MTETEKRNAKLRVLVPLPDVDFDTTESSVPWKHLTQIFGDDIQFDFATENGKVAECDPLLLTGVIFGKLGATEEAKGFYKEMTQTFNYQHPLTFDQIQSQDYDCFLLPGGHAKGMRQYLESQTLRDKVLPFFKESSKENSKKVTAAICHGVVLLARVIDPETGKSVLYEKKTTSLPKHMERSAYFLTAWKLGDYYRTYPEYVQDEVTRVLKDPSHFIQGPYNFGNLEGTPNVIQDGNYISARWPGDAKKFAQVLEEKLRVILESKKNQ